MILKNAGIPEFFREIKDKKIICFGAGVMFGNFVRECAIYGVVGKIECIVDNNEKLWNEHKLVWGKRILINSIDILRTIDTSKYVVVLLSERFQEMVLQLDNIVEIAEMEVYIYSFMQHITSESGILPDIASTERKIPKVIHYCWFGKNELPELARRCIDSWKRYCPDYEIVQWDESNYDVTKHLYVKQAYDRGAYAFVSDYARLDIVYNCGGIYLDTDVEILKSLDELLYHHAYCGFLRHATRIGTGLGFGAEKNFAIVGEWLDAYKYEKFEKHDFSINTKLCTEYQTDVLEFHRDFQANGQLQIVDGLVCYPRDYFDPCSSILGIQRVTDRTYSIHHGSLSWSNDKKGSLKNIREHSRASVVSLMKRIENGGRKVEQDA